ncbi:enoyl-CoA hydratase/isomerase family protein [Arthrobacter sp. ISL-28]|uniref:enoyl-CoA hydratase/isomerase family protein n=1 Tax=Arthrobacter sp. ISL-28 TaxID=2819108 RepID=UPI001BE7FA14|nr:enoyl-CoA hydratase-related protein [Arthrobacter sp. ISL-28]MBT2523322.1 enoyl-CoA hydratase/isomerase family protein [Arthrobacter sp. ISL-28]
MSGTAGRIDLERRGPISILTIDRPAKLNAFTLEMVRELEDATVQLQHDPSVRCLVVRGGGDRAFSAGGDLESLLPATVGAGIDTVSRDPTRRFFSELFIPVIAAIRGICIGGGLEIALGSDLRVAASDARFGLGEVAWGLIPGAGSHIRLPRQIPYAIAMQLILLGQPITAQRAYEVGLVNEVVEPGEEFERALELAEKISQNAPVAVRTAKEAVVRGLALTDGFVIEHALNTRVLRSDDAAEGPRAFKEHRVPEFVGR